MKRKFLRVTGVLMCIIMLVMIAFHPVYAAEHDIPTLFCGDEVWYKESIYPLVGRGGVWYIPAEMFLGFDYIDVSTPKEDNLLITNMRTGEYISILFMERSAAVNGGIQDNIGVFRDAGVYYVEAERTAAAVGLDVDYYTSDSGKVSLRLYGDSQRTFETIVSDYISENGADGKEQGADEPVSGDIHKRVYLLCGPRDNYEVFSAVDSLTKYEIEHTVFLTGEAGTDDILSAFDCGDYGVDAGAAANVQNGREIADGLDALSDRICEITRIKARFTLTTGDKDKDRYLAERGYITVTPDITVSGASSAERQFSDIISYINLHDSVIIMLEDCWNSTMVVQYLNETEEKNFTFANLAHVN